MQFNEKNQPAKMAYSTLCEFYQKLENTSSRLELTDILVELLRASPREIVDLICYLTTELFPPSKDLNLGMQEKTVIEALSMALGHPAQKIKEHLDESGDLGLTAEQFKGKSKQQTLFSKQLLVREVYQTFEKIAQASGTGSMKQKNQLLTNLITHASPLEAKYLARTAVGKLRLGIATKTLIDAISIVFTGAKENREIVERAFNFDPDIGNIAKIAAEQGLEGLKQTKIQVGHPILMMSAKKLESPEEILEKHEKTAVETKYDGERLQIHKNKDVISIFSRRQERITKQYPDVVQYIRDGITADRAIIEGEVVAYNPDTGEFFPFQILMRRRRKYGVEEARAKYPVVVFLFDVLLVNNESLVDQPFPKRREYLEQIVQPSDNLQLAFQQVVSTPEDLERLFHQAISEGHEGLIAKSLRTDSIYQAGGRGWHWIKYKKDYASDLVDTVDLVVVGAFWGRGRRSGSYGALLMAAYDEQEDSFKTVCKLGTGFSDEDLVAFREQLEEFRVDHPPARVDVQKEMTPDVWFVPTVVLEVQGAELTLSPTHTAGRTKVHPTSGLAIRFPRLEGRRPDKAPEQATTVDQLINWYEEHLQTLKK